MVDSICIQIICASDECVNHLIDATNASSLTLICNGIGFQGSKILCPTTDQSSCNISSNVSYGLQYAVIEVANGGVMRNFFLECSGSYSCQYTTVNIHNSSVIDDVSIDCSGSASSSTYSVNKGVEGVR